jgi:hypothetical protein
MLLSYIPAVCALVAPLQPGAWTTIIDRLSRRGPLAAGVGSWLTGERQNAARLPFWMAGASGCGVCLLG